MTRRIVWSLINCFCRIVLLRILYTVVLAVCNANRCSILIKTSKWKSDWLECLGFVLWALYYHSDTLARNIELAPKIHASSKWHAYSSVWCDLWRAWPKYMLSMLLIIVYQDMVLWKLNRSVCYMFLSQFMLICARSQWLSLLYICIIK
jgi:hypothetical protein